MSAISSPGNTGDRAYHSDPVFETRTYTLLEAIGMVTNGILSPFEIYRQMPEPLQKELDALANVRINSSFSELSIVDQRIAFQKLKRKIESYSLGHKPSSRTTVSQKTEISPSGHSNKKTNFFRKIINSIFQR